MDQYKFTISNHHALSQYVRVAKHQGYVSKMIALMYYKANGFIARMSASGSTTISISDVPFAYSIIGLLSIIFLEKPLSDHLYIVALGGSLIGTFLFITHPMQRLLEFLFFLANRKDIVYRRGVHNRYMIYASSITSALKTAPIRFERDRVVAIFYFIIILGFVLAALLGGSIGKVFGIKNESFLLLAKIGIIVALAIIFYMFLL